MADQVLEDGGVHELGIYTGNIPHFFLAQAGRKFGQCATALELQVGVLGIFDFLFLNLDSFSSFLIGINFIFKGIFVFLIYIFYEFHNFS